MIGELSALKIQHHTVISVGIAALFYGLLHSWSAVAGVLVGGILVDLDHLLDYVLEFGFRLDADLFFRSFAEDKYKKIFILLHAWELTLALIVVARLCDWNGLLVGAAVGHGCHMALDQMYNKPVALGYSLVYRMAKRFETRVIFPPDTAEGI